MISIRCRGLQREIREHRNPASIIIIYNATIIVIIYCVICQTTCAGNMSAIYPTSFLAAVAPEPVCHSFAERNRRLEIRKKGNFYARRRRSRDGMCRDTGVSDASGDNRGLPFPVAGRE